MSDYERVFTDEELVELGKCPPRRVEEAMDAGNYELARELCANPMMANYGSVQMPAYHHWNAQMINRSYLDHGFDVLEGCLRESITPWLRPIAETFRYGVTRENLAGLAQIWRNDSSNLLEVTEDLDKVVFKMSSRGWGGYLVEEGYYTKDAPTHRLELLKFPTYLTGGRTNFPIYATTLMMAEVLMIEWLGYPAFVVDLSEDYMGPFTFTVYKDPMLIPDEYFTRVGKIKNIQRLSGEPCISKVKLLSEEDLDQFPKIMSTRALEAIDAGDYDAARKWCELGKWDWWNMHHIGRDLSTGLLSYTYRKYGVEYLEVFDQKTYFGVDAFFYPDKPIREIVEEWCYIWHAHAGIFTVHEDEDKVMLRIHCGAGNKLISEGGYDYPKNFARIKEAVRLSFNREDFPIYCIHSANTNERQIKSHVMQTPFFEDCDGCLRNAGDCSKLCIYKSWDAVPARIYGQVNLEKPE